jgi:hypothetical protein
LKTALDEYVAENQFDATGVLARRERWGRFLLAQNDGNAAEKEFRTVLVQANGRALESVALAQGDLAQMDLARRDTTAALQTSQQAIGTFDQIIGDRDVRTGPMLWLIRSEVLRASGDIKGAQEFAQRALAASEHIDDPAAPSIVAAKAALASAKKP